MKMSSPKHRPVSFGTQLRLNLSLNLRLVSRKILSEVVAIVIPTVCVIIAVIIPGLISGGHDTPVGTISQWSITSPFIANSWYSSPNPGIVIDQPVSKDVWSQRLLPSYIAVQKLQNTTLTFNEYDSIDALIKQRDILDTRTRDEKISQPETVSELGFELNSVENGNSQLDFGYTLFYQSYQESALSWLVANMEAAAQSAYSKEPASVFMSNVTFRTLPSTALENVGSAADIIPIFVAYAVSFILLFYVTNMVREREHGQKQLLILAGLDSRAYYLAAFIRDMVIYLIPIAVFLIMLQAERTPLFVESSPAGYVLLLLLCGPPFILSGYLLSFMFEKSKSVGLVIGFLLLIIVFAPFAIIRFAFEDHASITTVSILSFFLPTFALQRGLTELATAWSKGYPYSTSMVFSFKFPILPMLLALIASTIFYGLLVICLEHAINARMTPLSLIKKLFRSKDPVDHMLVQETKVDFTKRYSDEEVANEKIRILENRDEDDTMHIQALSKEFPLQYSNRRRAIINDLWLTLRRNECLGYLGPNGAGKTTTIKMLIGALSPTSGNATIEGYSIVPYSPQLKQLVGVCQQFDVLFPELTGREHLRLFARLRGTINVEEAVKTTIEEMCIQEVADQKCKGYSGGNKRRLSIGMAAIGHPKILFLDEPTTGVDVHVRQSIWKAIRELKKNTSIVLTTHSMEEADALCDRIGITVNSQLAALGTPQRLKNVYGKGYKVNVRTGTTNTVESVIQGIFQEFGSVREQVRLVRRLGCNLEFEIEGSSLGKIFKFLHKIRVSLDIVDHAVAQTTLAQVFVEFAKQQGIEN
ncbi:hypothetical protein K7432_006045 [Basidiobolus ranarum]|uniref:ABC transporter domain-containing protein n=1 Tax=Basidiobolus ranarum TaxID=34480 RepID=A0ABR2WVP0_9FUNG